jgi:putative transcriptional regulator
MSRVGQILIAHPNLPQRNPFYQSVIYIYQDNNQGTMGVILNKETHWTVEDVCVDKNYSYFGPTRQLGYGGPVNSGALCMLHTDDWTSSNTMEAGNRLYVSSDNFMLEKLGSGIVPAYWRMFVGMCAWAPGQLDMELAGTPPYQAKNSWLTAKANDTILFEYDGEKQWAQAIKYSSQQMINSYF